MLVHMFNLFVIVLVVINSAVYKYLQLAIYKSNISSITKATSVIANVS